MNDDFTNIIFQYNGKRYTFLVSIFSDDTEVNKMAFNNTDIEHFEYVNEINSPILTGYITYVDKYGQVDKFLSKPTTFVRVTLAEMTQKFSGDVTVERINDQRKFEHVFLVQNIQILEREKYVIKYKISINSINVVNCLTNLSFSNYDKEPEDIYTILGSCIGQAGLNLGENFKKVKSGVKINYITNGNDNLFTVWKYLLNKTLYYNSKVDRFQYVYYNETTQTYELFDVLDKNTIIGAHSFVVSFFDSNSETLVSQEPVNIASVTQFPTDMRIVQSSGCEFTAYSLDENKFIDESIKTESVIDYFNNMIIDTEKPPKYYTFNTSFNLQHKHAFWNNNLNLYSTIQNEMLKDNSLVLYVDGDILRKPASIAIIQSDRSSKLLHTQSRKEMKDVKNKYLQFEGQWYILKVRHIIENGKYKQNLVLNRNFVMTEAE